MKQGKYDLEIVRNLFLDFGYMLDEKEYVNCSTRMSCHDKDGFKYLLDVNSVKTGRHPYKYHRSNKYSIDNIQMVLDKETDGTIVLSTEFVNCHSKLDFLCSCGNRFQMTTNQFESEDKRYCNYCSKSKRYDENDYTEKIKEKCNNMGYKLISPDRITRSFQKFEYICLKHEDKGIQRSYYDRFINTNQGCYYCGIEKRGIGHRVPIEQIIQTLDEKGFDYVNHNYMRTSENCSSKVRIGYICRNHKNKGIQYIDYQNLKSSVVGCSYCVGRGRTKEELQKEFDDKNMDITIIEFNEYSDIKVCCNKCGYEWNTTGININSGHGCIRCKQSRYEREVERILKANEIQYMTQYKFDDCKNINSLPFDFYLPDRNVLIEVDGQSHYCPVSFGGISYERAKEGFKRTIMNDRIKDKYCFDNGIFLLRIPHFILDNKTINNDEYILERI